MFDVLFGWRKASRCKKLIRRVQCRLKLLKNKRYSIVRQFREDVAQLLKIGREEIALNRAEQLYKDECIMAVYELLDHFCEFIIIHLSYIRRHKDCPNDINEAVSSLIFASARFGDLPELRTIRKLFGERYGQRFALTAVELLPGNLVNHQIKEKLSIKSVPEDVKHTLVFEIFREHCLHSGPLALEYISEWHQQQLQTKERPEDELPDRDVKTYHDKAKELQIADSDVKEIEVEAVYFGSSPKSTKSLTEECLSLVGGYEISSTSSTSSTVLGSSVEITVSTKPKKAEEIDSIAKLGSPYNKFRISAASSSEGSSWIPEEDVVYLDDIEEIQSPLKKDGRFQDQRLFIFKTSPLLKTEKVEDGYIEKYDSRKNIKKTFEKRLRKKSMSREKSNTSDADCATYYVSFPNDNSRLGHQRKPQNMILMDKAQEAYYAKKRAKQPSDRRKSCCSCNGESGNGCSLEQPCYFCPSHDKDVLEIQSWKQNKRTTNLSCPHKGPERKRSKTTKREAKGSPVSSDGSCSKVTSPRMKSETRRPPYLRAMTMPANQPKEIENENMVRSISFPIQQVNHVHPKLPDYDELAAKFTALKLAYLQTNRLHSNKA